jgi:hypothetical protein
VNRRGWSSPGGATATLAGEVELPRWAVASQTNGGGAPRRRPPPPTEPLTWPGVGGAPSQPASRPGQAARHGQAQASYARSGAPCRGTLSRAVDLLWPTAGVWPGAPHDHCLRGDVPFYTPRCFDFEGFFYVEISVLEMLQWLSANVE